MDVALVLDTNVVLYLLRGDLTQPLDPADYYVSVITEMELLSFPGLDRAGEAAIEEFLGAVTVVDLTPEIRRAAIALRARHGLKLPDAIIAATAQVLQAKLLTNDEALLRIEGLPAQSLALRANRGGGK